MPTRHSITATLLASLLTACSDANKSAEPANPAPSPILTQSSPTTNTPPPSPTPPTNAPTIIIDDAHNIAFNNSALAYQISPTAALNLDLSQIQFTYGPNPLTPNQIQFAAKKAAYALTVPPGATNLLVSQSTLQTVRGPAFPGFRPGDEFIFAIGRSTNQQSLTVAWAGKITVK